MTDSARTVGHPDQDPSQWGEHVELYEEVFEPLTDRFAAAALDALALAPGSALLDCAAGSGGCALAAARRGFAVTAADASPAMTARIAARAAEACLPIRVQTSDAEALDFADASFDAALSILGIVLCPDPHRALRELVRVTRRGGVIGLVTWTEPERYELASRLARAAAEVLGAARPSAGLPPQLRYRDPEVFRALFAETGLVDLKIVRLEEPLVAPSAAWLADRIRFAPGLADMLARFGDAETAIVARFAETLRSDQGPGSVSLGAVASLGIAHKTDA